MAIKQLGSLELTAGTWSTLYTCPSGKVTLVSKILCINRNSTAADFLILTGTGIDATYYISGRSDTLGEGGFEEITGGVILNAGDSIYGYSTLSYCSILAWGDEIDSATSTLKRLNSLAIPQNSWTTLYTCPSGKTTYISKIRMVNGWIYANNTDCEMYIAHVPSGLSSDWKYQIVSRRYVFKNGGLVEVNGGIVLSAGDKINVYSSGTYGYVTAYGDEKTAGTAKMLGAIDVATGAWTTLYTCPTGKSTYVSKVILTNNHNTSDAQMYLAHRPSGQSIAEKYYIIHKKTIIRHSGQLEIGGGICLSAGDILQVYTNISTCNAIAWGDEQ